MPEGTSSLHRELELRLPCRCKGGPCVIPSSYLSFRGSPRGPPSAVSRIRSFDLPRSIVRTSRALSLSRETDPLPSRSLPLPNNDPPRPLSPGSRRPNRGGPLGNVTHRRLSRLLIYKMGFLDTRRPVIVPARPAQRGALSPI